MNFNRFFLNIKVKRRIFQSVYGYKNITFEIEDSRIRFINNSTFIQNIKLSTHRIKFKTHSYPDSPNIYTKQNINPLLKIGNR